MMPQKIYLATAAAAFLYVISPGPAFLALFALAASKGRTAGAWFISGHLVGDITWGALAFAAIIGVNQVGPVLFELLGAGCGCYLIYLGFKAVTTKKDAPPLTIGARRPLVTGMMFGLTNPKAYPVAVAMFTAIAAPFASQLTFADAPRLILAAFAGFLTADMVLIFAAGLPTVRRFFLRHGVVVTRVVGVLFIVFGAKSMFDAANGALRREA
jgi:threonine/homoserine/homoserine lactone efflux protein